MLIALSYHGKKITSILVFCLFTDTKSANLSCLDCVSVYSLTALSQQVPKSQEKTQKVVDGTKKKKKSPIWN